MSRLLRPFLLSLLVVGVASSPVWLAGCKEQSAKAEPVVSSLVAEKADPVTALASLTDPAKLRTLKPEARSINGRMDKILYWLFVAEHQGTPPQQAIARAFNRNNTTEPRRAMATKQLLANYTTAQRWGMFTPENLARLKRGNAGLITKGSYLGQIAEVDHIVPLARYPQFANELANLQLLPAIQNRAKGDRMGKVEMEKLAELQGLPPTETGATAGKSGGTVQR